MKNIYIPYIIVNLSIYALDFGILKILVVSVTPMINKTFYFYFRLSKVDKLSMLAIVI